MRKVYMLEAQKVKEDHAAYMTTCISGVEAYATDLIHAVSPIPSPDMALVIAALRAIEKAFVIQEPKAAAFAEMLSKEMSVTTIALRFPKAYPNSESK